ncbi:MAG: hypothetical protein KGL39_01030 [Patescibacteria group bacterium]|nr:hypothetical protein [Patescibacteria group bacterium]
MSEKKASTLKATAVAGTATVTVSSAQLLSLPSTPVTIVAAPGADTYNIITSVAAKYNFGTTAYTVSGASPLTLKRAGVQCFDDLSVMITSASNMVDISQSANNVYGAPATYANAPIVLTCPNTGTISGGDGTLTIVVNYVTFALP